MSAISVSGLRKSYGDFEAVRGISFDVPEGSFFAFLGPNGAGKSTTISVICSLLPPDSGEVTVFGKDVSDPSVKREIGVVFQDPMMDGRLTVRENLSIRGGMYGLSGDALEEAVDRALDISGSDGFPDRRYGTLSGGQRRRADIARALVHGPRLLLLDEPTAGLDPQTRKRIWDMVTDLNDRSDRMTVVPRDMSAVTETLGKAGIGFEVRADTVEIPLSSTVDAVPIVALLEGMIDSLEVRTGTLDDAFIRITGEEMA